MDEIAALQALLASAQQAKATFRLSERSVIDLARFSIEQQKPGHLCPWDLKAPRTLSPPPRLEPRR